MLAFRAEMPILPTPVETVLLVGMALIGVSAYFALVMATRGGALATTTPFRYSRLVFALILGAVFFGERPDALTLLGSALIVGAGLYTMAREMRLARQR